MSIELEALHNYVIVKVESKGNKRGAIHLPDSAAGGNEDFAEVISVGPACEGVYVGDVVLCPETGDYEWVDEADDGQQYFMFEETVLPARVVRR